MIFTNADGIFYFQYIFEMGQVSQEINGGLILVIYFFSVNKMFSILDTVVYGNGIIAISRKTKKNWFMYVGIITYVETR